MQHSARPMPRSGVGLHAGMKQLAEVRAELEAVRIRLRDAEDGWAKSKAETDTLRSQTAAGPSLVNTDVERVMHRLLDRTRFMEAENA